MNQECSIVRDLLPLYAERLTSPETAAFVEKHLRTCADCRAALQETQAPPALQPAPDAAPLQHLQKRLARKRLQIIVMTALFVLTAVISAAGILNAPIYFPYTDDLVQVTEDAGALELTFRADVANVSTERFVDPDDFAALYRVKRILRDVQEFCAGKTVRQDFRVDCIVLVHRLFCQIARFDRIDRFLINADRIAVEQSRRIRRALAFLFRFPCGSGGRSAGEAALKAGEQYGGRNKKHSDS